MLQMLHVSLYIITRYTWQCYNFNFGPIMMSSRYDVINEISIYVDDHRWVCYELSCIMWIKCACVLYMNEFTRDTNSNLNEDDVT